MGGLPRRDHGAGNGARVGSIAWQPAFRLISPRSFEAELALLVFDDSLPLGGGRRFLAETPGHRSRGKLFLAVLRHCNTKQGCRARRSGAGARARSHLFVPAPAMTMEDK